MDDAAWTSKPERYIAATGSYCEWNTDVDLLSPIPSSKPPPAEDRFVDYYYNVLQYILYETGFPETVDETDVQSGVKWRPSEYGGDTGVTIAVLSNPIEIIGLLIEGGRQCPGDLLLVLSMTWVEKRKPTASDVGDDDKLYRLYVHKAIAFMQNGRSALRVYNPPRRVTYCVNFFTPACTGAMRSDGVGLEDDLDCTMVGAKLVSLVDDKLWTRIRASEVGVNVPETLAFAYRSPTNYDCSRTGHVICVVRLESTTDSGDMELIAPAVHTFVNSPTMSVHERVVVKPSGLMWMASMGVSFYDRSDVDSIVAACLSLLKDLQPGDSILVETFYPTLKPRYALETPQKAFAISNGVVACGSRRSTVSQLAWAATDQSACRFRATVCRGLDDRPHMTKVTDNSLQLVFWDDVQLVCGTACHKQPINGDNTIGQSFDSTLISFGLVDPVQRAQIYEHVQDLAEKMLSAIIRQEKTMSTKERGFPGAQTDLIGLDFILSDVNSSSTTDGALLPVVIEVNSMNCTCNCDLYEFMYRETSGEALQHFFEQAIGVSQRRQLNGRTVVVFGGDVDVVSKAAQHYKLHIIHMLTSTNQNPTTATSNCQKASPFYSSAAINLSTLDEIESQKERILITIRQQLLPGRVIDGCLSLNPHQVPLAAAIGSMLGLPESCLTGISGARTAVDIRMTQSLLSTRNAAIPQWPPSYLYSLLHDHGGALPASKHLLDLLDLGDAGNGVAFPRYEQLLPFVKQVHRVSVVIWRRKLLGGFVFDYISGADYSKYKCQNGNPANGDSHAFSNGYISSLLNGFNVENSHPHGNSTKSRTEEIFGGCESESIDHHLENACENGRFRWPTVLPDDKRDQLIIGVYQCVNELDLVSGLFTVDMTFNAVSPKLLRVVPCLDAASTEVDLLRSTSGVDLFVYATLIACNMKPVLPVDSSFQNHLRARRPNFGHRAFDTSCLSPLICTHF